MMGFEDVQKFNRQGIDAAMQSWGSCGQGWQTIAAEMSTFTKRSWEDGTATFEQLVGSRSLEQTVQIQNDYAKRSYENCIAQATRITNLMAEVTGQPRQWAQPQYKPSAEDRS